MKTSLQRVKCDEFTYRWLQNATSETGFYYKWALSLSLVMQNSCNHNETEKEM